jgi:uncharacterized membrane protein SpoIIM required for sporulation
LDWLTPLYKRFPTTDQSLEQPKRQSIINLDFWNNASPRRKRIISAIIIFILALVITNIATLVPLSNQQANSISNDINQTINMDKANGTLAPNIFRNNFMICLIMGIPILGPIFGFYVLYNSGIAIGAQIQTLGYPHYFGIIVNFLNPFVWIEFPAYSIAIVESIWLLRRIQQKRIKHEAKYAALLIALCAVILVIGAFLEAAFITAA